MWDRLDDMVNGELVNAGMLPSIAVFWSSGLGKQRVGMFKQHGYAARFKCKVGSCLCGLLCSPQAGVPARSQDVVGWLCGWGGVMCCSERRASGGCLGVERR